MVESEWHSELPDGRDVLIRRSGNHWFVRCGYSHWRSENLDVALARAIRADTDVVGHASEIDYAAWVRRMAKSSLRGRHPSPTSRRYLLSESWAGLLSLLPPDGGARSWPSWS